MQVGALQSCVDDVFANKTARATLYEAVVLGFLGIVLKATESSHQHMIKSSMSSISIKERQKRKIMHFLQRNDFSSKNLIKFRHRSAVHVSVVIFSCASSDGFILIYSFA